MKSFILHEDAARDWVADLIVTHELSEIDTSANAAGLALMPQLGLAWQPREPGQEDIISSLIRDAQRQGNVLIRPEHTEIVIEFVDDGDDWCYRFLLNVTAPKPVTLASPAKEVCQLGDDSVCGVDAAIGILREAAHNAEILHDQLDAFITAVAGEA